MRGPGGRGGGRAGKKTSGVPGLIGWWVCPPLLSRSPLILAQAAEARSSMKTKACFTREQGAATPFLGSPQSHHFLQGHTVTLDLSPHQGTGWRWLWLRLSQEESSFARRVNHYPSTAEKDTEGRARGANWDQSKKGKK